jgi:hypothetical protein
VVYFGRWGLSNFLGWPQTMIFLISASQVAGIRGVSYGCLANIISCSSIFFLFLFLFSSSVFLFVSTEV